MRLKINVMSWMVFLMLLFHMAEGRKHSNKYIVAKRLDQPIQWKGI